MNIQPGLSNGSLIVMYFLLTLVAVFVLLILWAQVRCIRGMPFKNPDGTTDDWKEQKVFYGIAWADVAVACPAALVGLVLIFTAPRWGFYILALVSFWFLWANVMTTVTSLRFEKPKITLQWLIVFPLGALVGLGYIVWTFCHFEAIYGL